MNSNQLEHLAAGMNEEIKRQTVVLVAYMNRVQELEIAIRAGLSFVQERHSSHGTYSDGHAKMVATALRDALRKHD